MSGPTACAHAPPPCSGFHRMSDTTASLIARLLAERWFFFAQARHPQNIYYQAVS